MIYTFNFLWVDKSGEINNDYFEIQKSTMVEIGN